VLRLSSAGCETGTYPDIANIFIQYRINYEDIALYNEVLEWSYFTMNDYLFTFHHNERQVVILDIYSDLIY
jgi:hypothetical protein